jgi:hypothetical protein
MPSHPFRLVALAAALIGLSCRRPPPPVPPAAADDDKEAVLPAAPARPAPPPRCTVSDTRWRVPVRDGGAEAVFEGGALAHGPGGEWLAWLDRGAGALVVSGPDGALRRESLGAGEVSAPLLALSGDGAVALTVVQRARERVHRLLAVGSSLRELFTQREAMDDGLSVALASLGAGVLVAWDEERALTGSAIVSQLVPHAAIAAGQPIPPPLPRPLTPEDQDAGDPVLARAPDGGAVLAWLVSHDVPAEVANQDATDIYVRALSAEGVPAGAPVRVTPGPAIRFGIAVLARPDAVWLAYRVAGDADHESRGDGGAVAVLKLGRDLRPTASPVYVTEADAVPSGEPVLLGDGDGVAVFWTERSGEELRTLRRRVDAAGRVASPAQEEPVLHGDLPVLGDRAASVAVVHGPNGEPGTVQLRCPPAALSR